MFTLIVTYSFDPEVVVYPFADEESAKAALRSNFENEKHIDMEENGYDSTASIEKDGCYAKIVNHFADRDDTTEWRVVETKDYASAKAKVSNEPDTVKIIVVSGIVSDIYSNSGVKQKFEVIDYDKDYEDAEQLSGYIDQIRSDPHYVACDKEVVRFDN